MAATRTSIKTKKRGIKPFPSEDEAAGRVLDVELEEGENKYLY